LISLEYLAGFFDGEGTFYIGKQKKNGIEYPHATVMLSQSGEEGLKLLEQIQRQHKGKIYQHLRAGEHKATKAAYKLYWNRKEAISLIIDVAPYLILKQKAAYEVLQYLTRND
jgi:hypothetical protein